MDDVFQRYLKGERGRLRDLALALGVNSSAISQWKGTVPILQVPAVEKATGISRHDLRPDFFGPHPRKRRAA